MWNQASGGHSELLVPSPITCPPRATRPICKYQSEKRPGERRRRRRKRRSRRKGRQLHTEFRHTQKRTDIQTEKKQRKEMEKQTNRQMDSVTQTKKSQHTNA